MDNTDVSESGVQILSDRLHDTAVNTVLVPGDNEVAIPKACQGDFKTENKNENTCDEHVSDQSGEHLDPCKGKHTPNNDRSDILNEGKESTNENIIDDKNNSHKQNESTEKKSKSETSVNSNIKKDNIENNDRDKDEMLTKNSKSENDIEYKESKADNDASADETNADHYVDTTDQPSSDNYAESTDDTKEDKGLSSEESDSECEYESAEEGEEIQVDTQNLHDLEETLTDEQKEERRAEAQVLKEEGNEWFRNGSYKTAIKTYSRALRTCPLKYPKDRAIMYSNRGACKMRMEENDNSIRDCSKALELHPHYMKALMRRAELYEKTDKLDEALADFQKILELDPSQYSARAACMRLPDQIKERNDKLKEEMMGKLKDLGNMVLRPFGLSTNNFKLNQDPNSGGYSVNFVQNADQGQ